MPLPKLPSKPATILATQDYPSAGAARPASKTPAAKKVAAPVIQAAIADVAKPVRNAATKIKQVAALMAAKPAPAPAASVPVAAPAVAPAALAKAAPAAKGKVTPIKSVKQAEQPHPAKHKAVEVQLKSSASRAADQRGISKLFVLDTNVLMHDPSSLFRFEEHDVYLPMMTLEELDNHKKGMTEVARNARQVSRTL
ncbi:MAG: PhoH family protein, partial [Janthinobacterium lividum]|nr:PhoH family protein [Janthinobacterium lividum]